MSNHRDEAVKAAAAKYVKERGDDCLCQRTVPNTPVGECIYCFCGCDVYEAYVAGDTRAKAELKKERPYLHYCAEWDEMLIDMNDPEFEACGCFERKPKGTASEVIDALKARVAELEKELKDIRDCVLAEMSSVIPTPELGYGKEPYMLLPDVRTVIRKLTASQEREAKLGEALRKTIRWAESASSRLTSDARGKLNYSYLDQGRDALAEWEKATESKGKDGVYTAESGET